MVATPSKTLELGGKKYTRKSDEKFISEYSTFQSVRNAMQREHAREFENLKMYAGIDNSQWPDEIQRFMLDEGRGTNYNQFTQLGTYNFIKIKLNGIAGSIVRNPFDVGYVADESEQAELTLALQQAFMSDKELMDWEAQYQAAVVLGNIYQGVLRMYVKTDSPANPMGNIALECMPPGCTLLDPNWKGTSTKDLNNIWTFTWMSIEKMKEKYSLKRDLIENEQYLIEQLGETYEQDNIDWNKDIPEKHGDQYLVIQHNYLKREKVTREFDPESGIVFWEWMDEDQKRAMAQEYGVADTQEITLWDNFEYVTTLAPGLTLRFPLVDQKEEFQIGRLKYFPWATERMNGKVLPMIDQLRDAQMEINKRQATITLAAETAVTSGISVDEAIVGMDQRKKEEFEKNRGNPRYVLWQKAGTSRTFPNAMQQIVKTQIPGDLFNIVNEMIDLMDRLVPQPAASEGRSEKSGESGILFAQKVEIAKTMQTTMLSSIKQLWNDIGEAYFFLAKQVYSEGRRTFTNAKGTQKVVINDTRYDQFGEPHVLNDFSALSRHRVVISEAPAGVNNRLTQRELNATLMQTYAPFPNTQLVFASNLVKSIDMNEVDKEEAKNAIELDKERIKAETEAAIANANTIVSNAQQAAQAGAGGMPGGGAPGGGMPGGAPIEEEMQALPQQLEGAAPPIEAGIGNAPSGYHM